MLGEAAALLALWKIIEATEHQKRSAVERYNAQLRAQVAERRRQGERAGEIQRHLLPQAPPAIEGYELTGICRPAEDVAGDFYDWCACADGSIDFTVADVMGKGVAAALVMAVLRTALRSAPLHLDLPGKIDAAAGLMSLGMSEDGLFVTLFHARLDPATGIVRYVDAGHGYCAIRRPGGPFVHLTQRSLPLGVQEGEERAEGVARLEPGDTLVVYSDGLVETDERTVELEEFTKDFDESEHAAEVVARLMGRMDSHPHDDVTLVVLRRLPDPSGTPDGQPGASSSSS